MKPIIRTSIEIVVGLGILQFPIIAMLIVIGGWGFWEAYLISAVLVLFVMGILDWLYEPQDLDNHRIKH